MNHSQQTTPSTQPIGTHPFRLAMMQVCAPKQFTNHTPLSAQQVSDMLNWIPLVALIQGGILVSLASLLHGFQAEIIAALVLLVWTKLGGYTSLTALAQIADDAQTQSNILAVQPVALKSVGIITLILTLLLKWVLLTMLIQSQWWMVIVLMPLVGWSFAQMVMTGARWRQVHIDFAPDWREQVTLSWLWPQWLLLLMALALTSGWTLTGLLMATWGYIVWWRKHHHGIDMRSVLAWVELTQLIWLLGLVLLLLPKPH